MFCLQGPTVSPVYTKKGGKTEVAYYAIAICVPKSQLYHAVRQLRKVLRPDRLSHWNFFLLFPVLIYWLVRRLITGLRKLNVDSSDLLFCLIRRIDWSRLKIYIWLNFGIFDVRYRLVDVVYLCHHWHTFLMKRLPDIDNFWKIWKHSKCICNAQQSVQFCELNFSNEILWLLFPKIFKH